MNQDEEDEEEKQEKPKLQNGASNAQNVGCKHFANKSKRNLLRLIDRRHCGLIDHNLGKVALMHLGIHECAYLESRSGSRDMVGL